MIEYRECSVKASTSRTIEKDGFTVFYCPDHLNIHSGPRDKLVKKTLEKLQKKLLSSVNQAIVNDIILFLENISFENNVLIIHNLQDKLINEVNGYIEQFNFISNSIQTSNNTISLNFNNKIVLNAKIVQPYLDPLLDRIRELDVNKRINVESIRKKIKKLLR